MRLHLLPLLAALPALLSLRGCETLSTASAVDTRPRLAHVPESVMRDCDPATYIPAGASEDMRYRLWGQDRQTLADCRALNVAKGAAIRAYQGQGTK